jgi:ElaB/YqjD/DUF883 family membrane-anchored ribosome-binding protein
MTDDIQMDPHHLDALKGDVQKLISDAGAAAGSAAADAKAKWTAMQPVLEEKLAKAQEHATKIGGASAGAATEMGKGFMGALGELRKAFDEAKKHFSAGSAESSDESANG